MHNHITEMTNEANINHTCPGCGKSEGHKWSELYTVDGVVIHRLQGVYITYCNSLERYFLLDEQKVLTEN